MRYATKLVQMMLVLKESEKIEVIQLVIAKTLVVGVERAKAAHAPYPAIAVPMEQHIGNKTM